MSAERAPAFVDAARRYSEQGWALIRADGKKPKGLGWEKTQPKEPGAAAGEWSVWGETLNIGIVCGTSGVAVIDVDVDVNPEGALLALLGTDTLPRTPIVRTGRGRLQAYFADPGGLAKAVDEDGIELRVGPHQCIAPPSVHPDTGRTYRWLIGHEPWDVPLAPLPEIVVEHFSALQHRNGGAAAPIGDAIPSGRRNGTLASLAGTMRRRGMSEAEISAALEVSNRTRCQPPLPDSEVEEIARSVSRYAPSTHPASAPDDINLDPVRPVGDAVGTQSEAFHLAPVDWQAVAAGGIPKLEYLAEPFLPRRKRIWAVGPAESGKSIWAAAKSAEQSRAGELVVYFSQENGLEEEARRFLRLRPDFDRLRLYVDQGLDLNEEEHRAAFLAACEGAALVVLDTLTACWSGDEDSNHDLNNFDRDVLKPLVALGASSLVLDHTGNPQQFGRRRGVSAPRGASTKGQKTDFLLEFKANGDGGFRVERGKKRGTHGKEPREYQVVDTPDDGLELVESEAAERDLVGEIADLMTEDDGADWWTANKLRQSKQKGGVGADVDAVKDALEDDCFESAAGPTIGKRKDSTYYRLKEAS